MDDDNFFQHQQQVSDLIDKEQERKNRKINIKFSIITILITLVTLIVAIISLV
jgi:uncharacterized membrane protein